MNTIAKITRAEASILIYHPNGGLCRVLALRPGDNGFVKVLNLAVIAAHAHGNDLSDLDQVNIGRLRYNSSGAVEADEPIRKLGIHTIIFILGLLSLIT